MLLNCGLEKTLENPLDCKEIQPVHPEGNHSWIFIGRTDVEAETPIFWPPVAKSWLIWKDPDRDRLKAGGGGEDREWDVWTASPTQWTWVWVNSGSWWWTGRPGVLWFMVSQRVRHDWATELNWTDGDLWSVFFAATAMTYWKYRWWLLCFSSTGFLNEGMCIFILDIMLLYHVCMYCRQQYSI